MNVTENSLELRILYPDVRTRTGFYENEVEGFKDGDHRVVSTLRKFAIPCMSLCISHGDNVYTYDINCNLNHIGQIDYNDTFAKIAAEENRLNMLIIVLSVDYLNTVIVDEHLSEAVKELLEKNLKDKNTDVAFAFVHNADASDKPKINNCFKLIFKRKFEKILSAKKLRTLGLGEMADNYNEYVGGVYRRKEELELAKQMETEILKINSIVQRRSVMRMMVFVPSPIAVHVEKIVYDNISGKLNLEDFKTSFHIKKDDKIGKTANILAIVFPLAHFDEILNILDDSNQKYRDIINAFDDLADPPVVVLSFCISDYDKEYIQETKDCLLKFYYQYLGLRWGDQVMDLRIIGIGSMDKKYVGADPTPDELKVVKKIEKEILKLRVNTMTIIKYEPGSCVDNSKVYFSVFDEKENVFSYAFAKRYSNDSVTKKYNIMLMLFPLSIKEEIFRKSNLYKNVAKEVFPVFVNSTASANFIFHDDHGKTDIVKAKEWANKIFFELYGLSTADILRFVDIETLEIDHFGERKELTKEESTMLINLQSIVKIFIQLKLKDQAKI